MYRLAMLGWQKYSFAPTYGIPLFPSCRSILYSCRLVVLDHEALCVGICDCRYRDVRHRVHDLEKAKGFFRDDHSVAHAFWLVAFDVAFGPPVGLRSSDNDGLLDGWISYSKFCLSHFPDGKRRCSIEHVGRVLSEYAILARRSCGDMVFDFTIVL